jgi:hypothetical protein
MVGVISLLPVTRNRSFHDEEHEDDTNGDGHMIGRTLSRTATPLKSNKVDVVYIKKYRIIT